MQQAESQGTGTRALIDALAQGDPNEIVPLGSVLHGLGRSGFGVLLFLAIPPAFFPGVAAVIGSPVIMLIGLQLLAMRREMWLPKALVSRGPHRRLLQKFDERFAPWLSRLEKWLKPRLPAMIDHPLAMAFTGLLLVTLGFLLALPIPFTNALFAILLLPFALALLERDGVWMLVAWVVSIGVVSGFALLSGELIPLVTRWLDGFVF